MVSFDESKHKRDELGRFAKMSATELSEELKQEILNNYSISGATSGAIESEGKRADNHAVVMYETFRKDKYDVAKISKISGYTKEDIDKIKNYLFMTPTFVPNFDIAQSWDRLRKGNPIEPDFILLKHELYEMKIKKENPNISHIRAHNMTNKVYNYSKAMGEWRNGNIKKKRSNKR